ncbi:MAG: hypothetical protein CVU06_10675, partial [Bacteroidetes bacterium HGW-Bacteroidetes-22]
SDTWLQMPDYPGSAFVRLSGFAIGGNLYLGCGGNDSLNEFWQYNTLSETWTERTPIPVARFSAVGFSIGNTGYIGTGDAGLISKSTSDYSYNDFWAYNPGQDSWTEMVVLNSGSGRSGAIGFSIGQKGYIGTGTDYYTTWGMVNYYKDFWELDFSVGITDGPLSINNSGQLTVYPNPATGGYFNADIVLNGSVGLLSLISPNGVIVLEKQVECSSVVTIPVSHLPSGHYILRLNENGRMKAAAKITLQ